jgi:hypothetical protein
MQCQMDPKVRNIPANPIAKTNSCELRTIPQKNSDHQLRSNYPHFKRRAQKTRLVQCPNLLTDVNTCNLTFEVSTDEQFDASKSIL